MAVVPALQPPRASNPLFLLTGSEGLRDHFNGFLDHRSHHALFNTSRGTRTTLNASTYSKSSERFRAWHGLLQGHHHILDLDQNRELIVIPLQDVLNRGGFFRRLLNRVVYYSGYHNRRMQQAIIRSDNALQQAMEKIAKECKVLQSAPFVSMRVIKQYCLTIDSLRRSLRYLQLISDVQKETLRHRTQQRCCLLQIALKILQAFCSCIRPISYSHTHSHAQAVELLYGVLYGYTTPHHAFGYPIGSTTVVQRRATGEAVMPLTIYAKFERSLYPSLDILLTHSTDRLALFTVRNTDFRSTEGPERITRQLHIDVYNAQEIEGDLERGDHQIWCKIIQIAIELFGREEHTVLSITTMKRNQPARIENESAVFAAAGFSFQNDTSDRHRALLLTQVEEARKKQRLFPVADQSTFVHLAFLYKGKTTTPTRFFTRLDAPAPAAVQLELDRHFSTWEEYIKRQGAILGDTGALLPF